MRPHAHALACFAGLALAACASSPPPAPANAATTSAPEASAGAASVTPSPAPTEQAPTAAQQRPLDVASFCPHDLRLYYGDNPADGTGTHVSIATGTTLPVPRKADGTVVIWVVDDKGEGLASVHVTRHMKHVRVNADCSRIDAN